MASIPLLNEKEAASAYDAAQKVVETHHRLADWLAVGQTLGQIDAFIAETLASLGCRSCFRHYAPRGMPKFPSHACLSVNDCVVHGTAGSLERPLEAGDLLKIDIGVAFRGWMGDAAWSYSFGKPTDENRKLMDAGKESLRLGIEQLAPGVPLVQWAKAVQGHVEEQCGFHLVRGLGGHGYGKKLHGPPFVSNTVPTQGFPSEWPEASDLWRPGTLVAVEPMIAVGTGQTRQAPRQWPIYSADGSMTVHHEHDVLVTDNGPRVLTAGLEEVADVITR